MELSEETIKLVFGGLTSVIVFMTGGFIYIFRKMESKLEEQAGLINKYMTAYVRLEERYKELKKHHDKCIKDRNENTQ